MELCPGGLYHPSRPEYKKYEDRLWSKGTEIQPTSEFYTSMGYVVGVKRSKAKCEKCGRKIVPSIRTCEDGCCVILIIPPHKPKRWWKKGK